MPICRFTRRVFFLVLGLLALVLVVEQSSSLDQADLETELRQRPDTLPEPFEQQQLPSRLAKDFKLVGGDVLVRIGGQLKPRSAKVRVKRKAMLEFYPVTNKPSRWPNNTVPYELDGDISELTVYSEQFSELVDKTPPFYRNKETTRSSAQTYKTRSITGTCARASSLNPTSPKSTARPTKPSSSSRSSSLGN